MVFTLGFENANTDYELSLTNADDVYSIFMGLWDHRIGGAIHVENQLPEKESGALFTTMSGAQRSG